MKKTLLALLALLTLLTLGAGQREARPAATRRWWRRPLALVAEKVAKPGAPAYAVRFWACLGGEYAIAIFGSFGARGEVPSPPRT